MAGWTSTPAAPPAVPPAAPAHGLALPGDTPAAGTGAAGDGDCPHTVARPSSGGSRGALHAQRVEVQASELPDGGQGEPPDPCRPTAPTDEEAPCRAASSPGGQNGATAPTGATGGTGASAASPTASAQATLQVGLPPGATPLMSPGVQPPPSSPGAKKSVFVYRPDIDGLRAVAVVAVVIYHLDEDWLPGGFTGVDIFFAISGYVVAASLLRHTSPSTCEYFVGFYSRRVKRLTPSLVLVVSLTGLFMSVFIAPRIRSLRGYYESGMYGLVGWANNDFAAMQFGYFDEGAEGMKRNPFTHTWSLGVEEQFYAVFPLIVLLAYGRRVSHSAAAALPCTPPWVVLALGIGVSVVVSGVLTLHGRIRRGQQIAFYIVPSRFWELASGAAVLEAQQSAARWRDVVGRRGVAAALELAAAGLIAGGFAATPHTEGFPWPWALPAIAGTLCILAAGTAPAESTYLCRLLGLRPLVYIGKLSYPIYLWHWPIFVIFRWTVGMELWYYKVIAVVGTLVLAAATYHLVEGFFRGWRPKRNWHVFASLLPLLAVAEVWLLLLWDPLYGELYGDKAGDRAQPNVTGNANNAECRCLMRDPVMHRPPGAVADANFSTVAPCFVNRPPGHVGDGEFSSECMASEEGGDCYPPPTIERKRACLRPDRGANGTRRALFIVGDSHSVSLVPGFREAVEGVMSVTFLSAGCYCGYLPFSLYDGRAVQWYFGGPDNARCDLYNKHAAELLVELVRPLDIVAVGTSLQKIMADGALDVARQVDYMEHIRALHGMLAERNASLLLLGDPPTLRDRGEACVPTKFAPNAPDKCVKAKDQSLREVQPLHQMLSDLTGELPHTYMFDYHDLLCTDTQCGAMLPGTDTLGFSDKDHLTLAGSLYLWPHFCAFLRDNNLLTHGPRSLI